MAHPLRFGPAFPILLAALALQGACDKDPPKVDPSKGSTSASATASATAAPTASTPAAPTKPQLAIDDTSAFVAGDRIDLTKPDPRGRLMGALGDKPIAGETVVLNAARETKLPRMTTLFSVLVAKKVRGVEVHTARRDKSTAEVTFVTNMKPADCSPVGYIAKDNAISVWPASGATAERFSHGMAGPDITRGSEGLRKRLVACDAPVWFLSADENITWGVLFDLELAATGNEDGGTPLGRPRSPALLVKTAVPGRKIEVETSD